MTSPGKRPTTGGISRAQMFALALATGTAAALLAYAALARQTAGTGRPTRHVLVVTAARDLPPRQVLSPAMLRVTIYPAEAAPPGAFSTTTGLVGKVTSEPIPTGQPLTGAEVTTRAATAGMAALVAPTRRAVSIPLDAAGGASGFLEVGDHVDVLATFDAGGGTAARLVVADARLLALGTHGASGDGGAESPATSATLEVTPAASQALALASARGRLTLALRGLGDDADVPLPDLPAPAMSRPEPPAPEMPPRPAPALPVPQGATVTPAPALPESPPHVTVVRGTQTTVVTVGE